MNSSKQGQEVLLKEDLALDLLVSRRCLKEAGFDKEDKAHLEIFLRSLSLSLVLQDNREEAQGKSSK